MGLGWSGFAVSGSSAFTQEQRGECELTVCYDLATGAQTWTHTNLARFSEPMGGDGPRATPTIAGGRVYALGATGILDCLDAASGKLVWSHDILRENNLPNTYFGKCSSPLVASDLVIVTGGMTNGSSLLALHWQDGSPAWKAGEDQASFTSPALATLAGQEQIVSINAGSVGGYDPKNGATLWEYAWGNKQWPKCAQPILLASNRLFFSASFSAGCVLLEVAAGPDGKLAAREVWKNRNLKSEFSNMVARDGFVYGLDDGILVCLDLTSGERKWKDGHYGHGQILLVRDLLLLQAEQGAVVLVAADSTAFREVARLNALPSKTWNTPALAGSLLLVRNDQEAVCYKLPEKAAQGAKSVAEN